MTSSDVREHPDIPPQFGVALRKLRVGARLTLSQLARKVHYSKSHLSKVENGRQQPTPQFARLCDSALRADGALTALVPAKTAADGATGRGRGIGRREAMSVGAASVLGLGLVGPADPAPAEEGIALDIFRSLFDHFRRLGQVAGPQAVLPALAAQTRTLRDLAGRAKSPLRAPLLFLGSRYSEFTGWMAQEAGDERAALRWTNQAVALATASGDRELAVYADVRRALIAMYRGDAAETVALSRAAAAAPAGPRVHGLAALQEAQGHALAGDHDACRRSLDRGRVLLDQAADRGDETLGSRHVKDPAAMVTAWCLLDLGRPREAAEAFDAELAGLPKDAMRSHARYGARRCLSYAVAGEIDRACALTGDLLASADVVNSATVATDLQRLNRVLTRFHRHPAVRDLSPRLAASLSTAA
ncbi:helix-turn-helix domain-containing protein [Streptomyces marincola]|uniref:helix-turn-helix domain-containing protein n=1 Tax=Streptomyces marincola TaxID=2878388 RepID=UPI001CF30DDD|nr:helix-turn-helix transcriptional regulator [Streptomyces marincola]UCM87808.1 helix-turn-helix domain-containing protein [Streptomyces marincola]